MNNMRQSGIKGELDRRFKEVQDLKRLDHNAVEDGIARFFYFLLSIPDIKLFLIELSKYDENFAKSDKFKEIVNRVTDAVKVLMGEFDKAGISAGENLSKFIDEHNKFDNPFGIADPDVREGLLSVEKYFQALREIDKYNNSILNGLKSIENVIQRIVKYAEKNEINLPADILRHNWEILVKSDEELEAFLKYKAEYDGAEALMNLIIYYHVSPYRYLLGINYTEFGKVKTNHNIVERLIQGNVQDYLINECRKVYNAVDRFLLTSKSKSVLINRLKSYCTWIKKDAFPKKSSKLKEEKISAIVEEFIFNCGYFPLVNFKTGKGEPDILIDPDFAGIHSEDSILIELKQTIGKSYSNSQLETDIGQAQDYYGIIKSRRPEVADTVYLLVFYGGNDRLPGKSFKALDSIPDYVEVEFIYVGDKTPSKLKQAK